jgi:hypothetical protein
MRRWMGGLLTSLAFTTLATAPAVAQVIASHEAPGLRRAALADAYHLRLRSAWPQLRSANDCRNGGDEIVEGMLTRDRDGTYHGSLDRRTRILFCGAHGTSGDACELVLEGDGKVLMSGVVVPDETSRSGNALRVSWRPSPSHGATVRGACSADFMRTAREMYLSVRHGAEFPLPAAGEALRERLENYAWRVEVD